MLVSRILVKGSDTAHEYSLKHIMKMSEINSVTWQQKVYLKNKFNQHHGKKRRNFSSLINDIF